MRSNESIFESLREKLNNHATIQVFPSFQNFKPGMLDYVLSRDESSPWDERTTWKDRIRNFDLPIILVITRIGKGKTPKFASSDDLKYCEMVAQCLRKEECDEAQFLADKFNNLKKVNGIIISGMLASCITNKGRPTPELMQTLDEFERAIANRGQSPRIVRESGVPTEGPDGCSILVKFGLVRAIDISLGGANMHQSGAVNVNGLTMYYTFIEVINELPLQIMAVAPVGSVGSDSMNIAVICDSIRDRVKGLEAESDMSVRAGIHIILCPVAFSSELKEDKTNKKESVFSKMTVALFVADMDEAGDMLADKARSNAIRKFLGAKVPIAKKTPSLDFLKAVSTSTASLIGTFSTAAGNLLLESSYSRLLKENVVVQKALMLVPLTIVTIMNVDVRQFGVLAVILWIMTQLVESKAIVGVDIRPTGEVVIAAMGVHEINADHFDSLNKNIPRADMGRLNIIVKVGEAFNEWKSFNDKHSKISSSGRLVLVVPMAVRPKAVSSACSTLATSLSVMSLAPKLKENTDAMETCEVPRRFSVFSAGLEQLKTTAAGRSEAAERMMGGGSSERGRMQGSPPKRKCFDNEPIDLPNGGITFPGMSTVSTRALGLFRSIGEAGGSDDSKIERAHELFQDFLTSVRQLSTSSQAGEIGLVLGHILTLRQSGKGSSDWHEELENCANALYNSSYTFKSGDEDTAEVIHPHLFRDLQHRLSTVNLKDGASRQRSEWSICGHVRVGLSCHEDKFKDNGISKKRNASYLNLLRACMAAIGTAIAQVRAGRDPQRKEHLAWLKSIDGEFEEMIVHLEDLIDSTRGSK